jgi:hypothetical protein
MVYYIFLKSLTILEEFRKNPQIKIPRKSPCTNFQSLAKIQNSWKLKKIKYVIKLSFDFGPAGLDLQCRPTLSWAVASLLGLWLIVVCWVDQPLDQVSLHHGGVPHVTLDVVPGPGNPISS